MKRYVGSRLLLLSAAQDAARPPKPTAKPHAATQTHAAKTAAKCATTVQPQSAVVLAAQSPL